MNDYIFSILLVMLGLLIGLFIAFVINSIRVSVASKKVASLMANAKKEIEKMKRDAALEQKEEAHKLKMDLDKEIREKKEEIKESENRLLQREASIDKRDELCQKRESSLDEREDRLSLKNSEIQNEKSKVDEIKKQQLDLLEQISGFSKEKAKEMVMSQVKENMSKEIAEFVRESENEAKLTADRTARELIVTSMQKYAADIAGEQTVTVVDLPNDEMKGRIIGREGRNIRTIEAITGVDLIIDDTPEAVVLSSFDPLRREIARVTLETLIKDGRIHPTRIEELYDKVCQDMKQQIIEYGQDATFELGLTKFDPELIEIIGKLHFRTSYGQNALQHSLEVAHLSGLLAGELGENTTLAKRAGLLHDIGKAIDHEVEGSHVDIGVDIAKKYHEDSIVINAIASHHGDTPATSVIASIVAIADALSASRPGARNDSLENYIKRLSQLEEVGNHIPGVEKSYAVQAGRELRVIVKPEEVDDLEAHKIAREVKEQIEANMKYPGTIKITVVRETRAQEEAK
ncbi:MAG TPA: ribonuclease Y [Candidatus Faecimonas intestinavium]|jgi:ribonuclease Y|nr:ribonuclease Y [Candidatus Faecimonas intestinavium]